jgi:hypothetical protein
MANSPVIQIPTLVTRTSQRIGEPSAIILTNFTLARFSLQSLITMAHSGMKNKRSIVRHSSLSTVLYYSNGSGTIPRIRSRNVWEFIRKGVKSSVVRASSRGKQVEKKKKAM